MSEVAWANPGSNPQGSAIDVANGVLYVLNGGGGGRINSVSLSTAVSTTLTVGLGNIVGLAIDSTKANLYYTKIGTAETPDSSIQQYNIASRNITDVVSTGLTDPYGIAIDSSNTYLYVSSKSLNIIYKVLISTGTFITLTTTGPDSFLAPYGIALDSTGDIMYVTNTASAQISKLVLSSLAVNNYATIPTTSRGVAIDSSNTYMYVTGANLRVYQIEIANPTNVVMYYTNGGMDDPTAATIGSGNTTYLYVSNSGGSAVSRIVLPEPPTPLVCFKEGSKILTDKGYVVIQDLRNGDMVKTSKHGFKPIDMIGKRDIVHRASEERIKDQLYKCSQSEYPELFEPLVITGCHSILVDEFDSPEQREQTFEVLGDIFVTDKKYRLPACIDTRTTVYEEAGACTIYHLALENDDYYTNYGIYANGLLVETCSKRYLKELSNMELIE